MSKRFGRNQRRKMREALSASQAAHSYAVDLYSRSEQITADRERRMVREHAEQIKAARMARDSIRIDVNSLIDPREMRLRIQARFENMSMRTDHLYSALEIDTDQIARKSEIERGAFVTLIGEQIAEHALQQIMRHWRAR